MLDHLDDPRPPHLDRAAVVARGRRLRRRRRALAGGGGLLAVGVAGALYVDRRDDAIDRVDVSTPSPSVDGAVNILVVGTDDDLGAGARTDTIALVRLDGDEARVLFVPRDLWDEQAGQRINGAAAAGGAQGLIDAVDRVLGLPVDHYVAVGFDGFRSIVDDLGGLRVAVDAPLRDRHSGLALDPSPCATLDGQAALALVRARHLEQLVDGVWQVDPTGDLGRIARARVLAGAVVEDLAGAATDPLALDRLSRVLADHATVDSGLTLRRLVDLGRRLADAGDVATSTVPVEPFTTGGGAAVLRVAAGADLALEAFGGPETGAIQPYHAEPTAPIRPC